MKIYEKDGAMWAEHDGWTVCATEHPSDNPFGKCRVGIKDSNGLVWIGGAVRALCEERGFPPIEGVYSQYHQTLRNLMEKPACAPAETQEKRPITEWSDDLIGATVEAIARGHADGLDYVEGDQFVVSALQRSPLLCKMMHQDGRFYLGNFTIVKKADESKVIEGELVSLSINGQEYAVASETIEIDDPFPKTRTEYTHSALLEFPNSERVKIPPPPDNEGWEAEVICDENEWPHKYYDKNFFPGEAFCCHKSGELIYREYRPRASCEKPRIVSLTKWTREVVVPEPTLYIHSVDRTCEFVNSTWPKRHPPGAVKEME